MTLLLGFYIFIALGIAMFITSGADRRDEYKDDGQ